MKCEFCGANIDIESEICPFCGMTKNQFKAHRRDMDKFSSAYKNVEEKVVEKNRRTTEKTVRVTIVTVLCLLIAIVIVLHFFSYSIVKVINQGKIKANATKYLDSLSEYEENEDYIGLYSFTNYNNINYMREDSRFAEYRLLSDMSRCYYYCISNMSEILYYDKKSSTYENIDLKIESFVDNFEEMYKRYDQYVEPAKGDYMYDDKCFNDTHMQSYETMMQYISELTMTYFNMTEDEYKEFVDSNKAKKIIMIEEGLSNE